MVEIVHGEKVIRRSRNLRGLLDYARKVPVETVDVFCRPRETAGVYVIFTNGAICETTFASYEVALRWFRGRRSWGLTESEMDCAWHLFDARKSATEG